MTGFISWLSKTGIFFFSIIHCCFFFAVKILFGAIKNIFSLPEIKIREKLINSDLKINFDIVVDALILAPIFETLLFQSLFYFAYNRFKWNKWFIVSISGVVFGIYHNYSLWYIITTILIGMAFMFMYIKRAEVNNKPYLSTAVAHFTINLAVILSATLVRVFN